LTSLRLISTACLLLMVAGLSGCGGGLDLTRWSASQSFRSFERTLEEPDRPALLPLESMLERAAKLSRKDPGQAVDLYLEVAERTVTQSVNKGDEARIYRHATGHALALMHPVSKRPAGRPSRYRVSYAKGESLYQPEQFDSITFADACKVDNADLKIQEGIGAPMIGRIEYSAGRKQANPFLHPVGIDAPATALVEFPSKGRACITLCNTGQSDQVWFRGAQRTLVTNFTTPLIASMVQQQTKRLGWRGVRRPAEFMDEMGLYSIELIDPTKIPVVFTHGLGSRPATWLMPYNALLAEKWFRENYQVFGFYYPTGLPPMYPAAGLRQGLEEMHRELQHRGAGKNVDRAVLVGHSMGGLITSFQIRDFRGTSDQLFNMPIEKLPISDRSRQAMTTMLEKAPPHFVKRVVFIATPHRGSDIADNWIGHFVSWLVQVPRDLLTLQIPEVARSLTALGRELAGGTDPLDGVARLKPGNPLLSFTLKQPVARGITYHSIIGDQGKGGGTKRGDEPESSDGVVPYWSSHLDGAASEKIVPSDHSAHNHPEAIVELKRILQLHLK